MSLPPRSEPGGDPYLACRTLCPESQRPFRFGAGPDFVPDWLRALMVATSDDATRDALPDFWFLLVAHVANEDHWGGRFDPRSPAWLEASGLDEPDALVLAMAFLGAGGLAEDQSALIVTRWAEDYQCSPFLAEVWAL